jgi:hypothetical protein
MPRPAAFAVQIGTIANGVFTIGTRPRYSVPMLSLVAFAVAASVSPSAAVSVGPAVQARATVQIISGVRLKLDGQANADAPAPRDSVIQTNGEPQPARLIEFQ